MLVGHLAVSALEHRYIGADLVPVMAAAVIPDVVDKVAHYILKSTESGRLWGHTLFVALASTALVWLVFGRSNAMSWALGYLSHLICDLGGVVPWLYPLVSYDFPPAETFQTTLWQGLTRPRILLELALVVWAYVALRIPIREAANRIRAEALERWRR